MVIGVPQLSRVALMIDAENLMIEMQKAGLPFRLRAIIDRVREEGNLVLARAYADWTTGSMRGFVRDFQTLAIEMEQLCSGATQKNTADIQLAVDTMELTLQPLAPDIFVIVAGDRDFVPLVQKLKRYGKQVIGIGVKGSISRILAQICDAYIYYDDLVPANGHLAPCPTARPKAPAPVAAHTANPAHAAAFDLLVRAIQSLARRDREALGSTTHTMMRQLDPSFDLASTGFSAFKPFVQAAEKAGYVHVNIREGLDFTLEALREPAETPATPAAPTYAFGTVAEAVESYRQILLERKRVPLLPWEQRRALVTRLWETLAEEPETGVTLPQMQALLQGIAEQHGLHIPEAALQKILMTLVIAKCFGFKGTGDVVRYYNPAAVVEPVVSCEDALEQMNRTYVTGIASECPEAPLLPEALAQLLFDSTDEASVERVGMLITLGAYGNRPECPAAA